MNKTIKATKQNLNPKQLAKDFIRPYVIRGDSYDSLKYMGRSYLTDDKVSVSIDTGFGEFNGKRVTNDQICVTIGDDKWIFKKLDIIDEIKSKQLQLI